MHEVRQDVLGAFDLPASREEPWVPVQVGGHTALVQRTLCDRHKAPPVATVTTSVSLTVEDVAVILFEVCMESEELEGDAQSLRQLVACAVMNAGCAGIEEWRCRRTSCVRSYLSDAAVDAHFELCRRRAAEVFAGAVVSPCLTR